MFATIRRNPVHSNSSPTISSNIPLLLSPKCKSKIHKIIEGNCTNTNLQLLSQDFDYINLTGRKAICTKSKTIRECSHARLNKFVKRLYDMLMIEKDSGIVAWRRGLLVLKKTEKFSTEILPKYFNTRNFKTFRRQLNYYGFVHVRSFSATGDTTTALWINQKLAEDEANDDISAVLKLRRVEPDKMAKTVEGRRLRKELAIHTVEEDIGLNSKTLQLDPIRSQAAVHDNQGRNEDFTSETVVNHRKIDLQRATQEQLLFWPEGSKNQTTAGTTATTTTTTHIECSSVDDELRQLNNTRSEAGTEISNTNVAANVLLMLSRS